MLNFFRDSIRVNDDFARKLQQQLDAQKLPPDSTIVLAAREIRFDNAPGAAPFVLKIPRFNLLMLADVLEMGAGVIDLSGAPGPAGTTGALGAVGQPGWPGGVGGPGGQGATGETGADVSIFARGFAGGTIRANGGEGGPGGRGGTGGFGGPHIPEIPEIPGPIFEEGPVSPPEPAHGAVSGGDGGVGGPGGRGGDAGLISLVLVNDLTPGGFDTARAESSGGRGGPAGEGGGGGTGISAFDSQGNLIEAGQSGNVGPMGDPGPDGLPATPRIERVSDQSFLDELRSRFPEAIKEWVSYRLKVGGFLFRSFRPNVPEVAQNIDMALGEFNRVLDLDPQNSEAAMLRMWLLNDHNIFGLPRQVDIIPDFAQFQEVADRVFKLVNTAYDSAERLLILGIRFEVDKKEIASRVASLRELAGVLGTEKKAAESGLAAANQEVSLAELRIQHKNTEIIRREQELTSPFMGFGQLVFQYKTVFTAISGLATGGAGLVAALPAVVQIAGFIKDTSVLEIIKDKEKKEDFKRAAGGIGDLINGTNDFISISKLFDDIGSARSDDSLLQRLTADLVELRRAELVARLHLNQGKLQVQAAEGRIKLAQNDARRAEELLKAIPDEFLQQYARSLYTFAQRHLDVATINAFLAARALEIYMLEDLSERIRYDYGYVHPDREQDLSGVELLKEYVDSKKNFISIALLDEQLRRFQEGHRITDVLELRESDPSALAAFRASRDLLLDVKVSDIPSRRFEAKAESVRVVLIGAHTKDQMAITCIVEHSGRGAERKRDGKIAELTLQPRPDALIAAPNGDAFSGTVMNPTNFRGRPVATAWHIYIESDEADRAALDLSELSQIRIDIFYRVFFV